MQQSVLVTGAFDLFHAGHNKLLKTAKALADACGGFVVCFVNSDAMIRSSKGTDRPRQPLAERQAEILLSGTLDSRDKVYELTSEEELNSYCKWFNPIRVLGSDYIGQPVTGAEHCALVLFIQRSNESTTEKIKSLTTG